MGYGKLQNGSLTLAPYTLRFNGRFYLNPSDEILAEAGYLPIVEVSQPSAEEGQYYDYQWVEEDGVIIQKWYEIEPPQLPKQPLDFYSLQEQIEALDLENKLAIAELAELILGGTE